MRSIMIPILCVGSVLAFVSVANAEPTHDLGGPVKSGKMCWASTDGIGGVYGYWAKCPSAGKMKMAKTKKMKMKS